MVSLAGWLARLADAYVAAVVPRAQYRLQRGNLQTREVDLTEEDARLADESERLDDLTSLGHDHGEDAPVLVDREVRLVAADFGPRRYLAPCYEAGCQVARIGSRSS
jgi:hypothetical protein